MNLFQSAGQYSKFIVAVLGAVAVGLTTFEHGQPWVSTILSAISAISVYLVPNTPKPAPQVTLLPGTYSTGVSTVHPADGTTSPPVSN